MARAALMIAAVSSGPFDCGQAPAYGGPPPGPVATTVVDSGADTGIMVAVAAYGAPAPPPTVVPSASVGVGPITTTDAGAPAPKDPRDSGVPVHRAVPAYGLPPMKHELKIEDMK